MTLASRVLIILQLLVGVACSRNASSGGGSPASVEGHSDEEVPVEGFSSGGSDGGVQTTTDGGATVGQSAPTGSRLGVEISVRYEKGTAIEPYTVIYAIWLESRDSSFLAPLYVCNRLKDDSLTGTALPTWSMNKSTIAAAEAVDAVTGATVKAADFTVVRMVEAMPSAPVTLYVEMDHAYDRNDWFDDQPAVLWAAEIDVAAGATEVVLEPVGWTPNEKTDGQVPGANSGVLQSELRYITHRATNGGFGDLDERSATHMVGRLSATIIAE